MDGKPVKHSLSASFHPSHHFLGWTAKKGQVLCQEDETNWQHPESDNWEEAEQPASNQEEGNRNAHNAGPRPA